MRGTASRRLARLSLVHCGRFGSIIVLVLSCVRPCWAATPEAAPVSHATSTATKQSDTKPATAPARPVPEATYWLAGAAVGSFVTAGVLYGSALSSQSDALDRCAPGCPTATREDIDRRLLTADIMFFTGGVLGLLALSTYVFRPTIYPVAPSPAAVSKTTQHIMVSADPSGAMAAFRLRF